MAPATVPLTSRSVGVNRRRAGYAIALVVILGTAGLAFRGLPFFSPQAQTTERRVLPARVSALGRLTPEDEVIVVAAPTGTDGARVERFHVGVGDVVKAGQVVATLDTHDRKAAAVREAQAKVEVARAKLAQVLAGPKLEDVRNLEAATRRSEADLVAAQEDYDRANRLLAAAALSREEHNSSRLKFQQARASVDQARAQCEALKLVRPVDVKVTEAEVAQDLAALASAEEDWKTTRVCSPVSGRVLRIRARPGERIGDQGILEVGNTEIMHVVAEVYEEDVGKVRIGQPATARVPTLGTELSGTVVGKDLVVSRKVIFSNDPVADVDARVVEIRIRLKPEEGARVAGLSNARAEVVIDVAGGKP